MKIITFGFIGRTRSNIIISAILGALATILFITLSATKSQIFPDNFFFDQNTIIYFINNNPRFSLGDSYSSTAAIYKIIGAHDPNAFFVISTSIFVLAFLYSSISKTKKPEISVPAFFIFIFLGTISSIYLTMISKELIVLILVFAFFRLTPKGISGLIAWTLIAVAYSTYFRTYWFLIIVEFWAYLLILRRSNSLFVTSTFCFISLLILSYIFNKFLGVDLDSYRLQVNDWRTQSGAEYAKTMITPFISGDGPIISWVNSCITLISLLFPLPLLLTFSPYYISIFLSLTYTSFFLARSIQIIASSSNLRETSPYIALILSVVTIQSIFEPDYGSYLKHLSPFSPIILYLIFQANSILPKKRHP